MKPHFYLVIIIGLFINQHLVTAQIAFAPAIPYSVGRNPRAVTAADVNGDGKVDLIIANASDDALLVLTNNGSGILVSNATYTVGFIPTDVIAADVNGDGNVDLICTDEINLPSQLTVLTNNGSGGFVLASTLNVYGKPTWLMSADINGDGKLDLISANYMPNTIEVFTNKGSGVFSASSTNIVIGPQGTVTSVAVADVNGDGKLDLIAGTPTSSTSSGTLVVFTNNGSSIFVSNATYNVGSSPRSVIVADVNGDGYMDLICANALTNTLSVLTNNGTGVFGSNATYTVGYEPYWVIAADVNNDGKLDLVCANRDNTLTVLTNDGSGNFTLACTPQAGSAGEPSVVAADVNGDGHLDLIVTDTGNNTVSVLISVPTLAINSSVANALVSWPSFWTNWTLQQNFDLTTTNWSASSGIVDDGTNKNLTITPPQGNLFFRLLHL